MNLPVLASAVESGPPSYRGTGTPGDTSSGLTVAASVPPCQNGDLLVAFMWTSNTIGPPTWTSPAGFTEKLDSLGCAVAYHPVTDAASEPPTYTFTCSSSTHIAAHIIAIPAAKTIEAAAAARSATRTWPAVTTVSDKAYLLLVGGSAANDALTPPAGITSRFDAATATFEHYVFDGVAGAAGATSTFAFTGGSAVTHWMISCSIPHL